MIASLDLLDRGAAGLDSPKPARDCSVQDRWTAAPYGAIERRSPRRTTPTSSPAQRRVRVRSYSSVHIPVTIVLLGLLLPVFSSGAIDALADTTTSPAGVVAFPFENLSEDRSLYWVTEALADGLLREIGRSGGLAFDRSERLSVVEEMGVPASSTLTLASQIKATEALGAAALVSGTFRASEGTLTVRARVVDVVSGRTGEWIEVRGAVKDIYALQRGLYAAIRPSLPRLSAGRSSAQPAAAAPEDGAPQSAYEFLLKSWFEDTPQRRELLLRHALESAPEYLRAQVELAQIYSDSGQNEKAAGVLAKISTRDRTLAAQAENLLAEIELARDRTPAAEAALRRSLSSKETARAHLLLAKIALARSDRAAAQSELARSRALDPDDPELGELEGELPESKPAPTPP